MALGVLAGGGVDQLLTEQAVDFLGEEGFDFAKKLNLRQTLEPANRRLERKRRGRLIFAKNVVKLF